jgi:isopentenyldiphosphate isomerase
VLNVVVVRGQNVVRYMSNRKPRNYWTKGKCHKEALKYKSKIDYQKYSKDAYLAAFRNNWLGDITKHMIRPTNQNKIWYKRNCKIEALKYKSRTEFYCGSIGAYKAAHKNHWLDEVCSHMLSKRKPKNYWTKENVLNEALKYTSKKDFHKNSKAAYVAASKNDWLNSVCKHMKICGNILSRCVYVYEFSDNYAYIGLTCDDNRRQKEHLKTPKSPVFKHISETGLSPRHRILSDGYIDVFLAKTLEKESLDIYRSNGWNILNSNRTGGIGSISLPFKN